MNRTNTGVLPTRYDFCDFLPIVLCPYEDRERAVHAGSE